MAPLPRALADPLFIAVKAALSALLAWAGVTVLGVPDALSATFVAVVCVSPTVYSGLRRGLDQLAASAIGGVIVWVLASVLPTPAVIAIGLFLTVWLTFRLGFARAYVVAAFTVLYMVLLQKGGSEQTFLVRLASVGIGVAAALVVNTAVSLPLWHSVFARRLKIARLNVAGHFELLSRALKEPVDLSQCFEDSFPLLRELLGELSDALRESRLRGGRPLAQLEQAVVAAERLVAVAHYGKDLALRQGQDPQAAEALSGLAAAMRDGVPFSEVERGASPRADAIHSATIAWHDARTALLAFEG